MKHWLTGLTIVILLTSATSAQNIGFLSKGPIAYLDEDEKAMLSEALHQALENSADGETVTWENPKSGNHGKIEMLDTHEDYGTTCHTVRTYTHASGREGGGIYRLCLADDNTWRFAPRRRSNQP